ncbi:30S ribosomal protein S4e [Candidatus Woesearchaeota archaeon]|nr:30S ribosomal protein S4e [Candidatus Woesearchaeota archaeon]
MVKSHLKRIATPKTWKIKRKKNVFVTRPKPGAHKISMGVSLNTFFKEVLRYCKTTKEVRQILHNKEVLVDGKRRKNPRFLVGLMDVVSIPSIKENYRLVLSDKGVLTHLKIEGKEANLKPSKIMNKTLIKEGKVQLNLSDGRNILLKKDSYKTGDTLLFELPSQKIVKHLKLGVGSYVVLGRGKHAGMGGVVSEIKDNDISFKNKDGEVLKTKKAYAFVVGEKKAEIKI